MKKWEERGEQTGDEWGRKRKRGKKQTKREYKKLTYPARKAFVGLTNSISWFGKQGWKVRYGSPWHSVTMATNFQTLFFKWVSYFASVRGPAWIPNFNHTSIYRPARVCGVSPQEKLSPVTKTSRKLSRILAQVEHEPVGAISTTRNFVYNVKFLSDFTG